MIPASSLQRLDWMYQDRNASMAQKDTEEYLLGKPINQIDQQEKDQVDDNRFIKNQFNNFEN